jgi:hypothetical protein
VGSRAKPFDDLLSESGFRQSVKAILDVFARIRITILYSAARRIFDISTYVTADNNRLGLLIDQGTMNRRIVLTGGTNGIHISDGLLGDHNFGPGHTQRFRFHSDKSGREQGGSNGQAAITVDENLISVFAGNSKKTMISMFFTWT